MAAKDRKKAEKTLATSGNALRDEAERLIAKGRLKDAVKQAKLAYKEKGDEENHRLLERAYFLRARQLKQDRLPESGGEVAHHLLEFGITDPKLMEEAVGLLIDLGMAREAMALQERLGVSTGSRELLLRRAADQAVLHPELAKGLPAEIVPGAAQVRSALTAVERGDEEGAFAALREVARGSPFADWRLFVRGLAAYERGEVEEAKGAWERLDPERAAARIARSLQRLAVHPQPDRTGRPLQT